MKKLLYPLLLGITLTAQAQPAITPLDIELGYWEMTSEMAENDMMKQMLANVPEAQRAQMKAMMQSQMKPTVIKQCITKQSMQQLDKQFQQAFAGQQQCQFKLTQSTSQQFSGVITCTGGVVTEVHTKVINTKRHETNVTTQVPQMGTNKIKSVAQWISATCPAGL